MSAASDDDRLTIAGRSFRSRLLLGTGKFGSPAALERAIEQSQSEIVTVAVRRVALGDAADRTLSVLDPDQVLP